MYERKIDIEVPGKGPELSIRRTWNSNDPVSGLLGHGWTFNLGRSILPIAGNDGRDYIIVRRENGQELKMVRNGNSYQFTTDMQYNFAVQTISSGWRIIEKNGSFSDYNGDGKPVSITDNNGLSVTLKYESVSGCISRATNASGNWVQFTRNSNGKLASVADNYGRKVQYTYDSNDNLVSVTYWDGSTLSYGYDSLQLLTVIRNKRGDTVNAVSYNEYRRVAYYTERGDTFFFSYDDANHRTTKRDNHGRSWVSTQDENGVIISETDPMGFTTQRQPSNYASARGMEWELDANGNRTSSTWDANGNMTSRTDPLGNTERWTYTTDNQVSSHTNALSIATDYSYDANGNTTRKREAAGTTESREFNYAYNANGNLISETDPMGNTTTYVYDGLGNKILRIGPLGDSTRWTYDSLGRMTSMTDPVGSTWTYRYDAAGNLTGETDPLGNTMQKIHDADNNLICEINQRGDSTRYVYDAWSRLVEQIGPNDDTTVYQYTALGDRNLLTGRRDAMHHWTYYQYDNAGRKTSEIVKMNDTLPAPDADDPVTTFVYDNVGNVKKITNPNGDTTGFAYDKNNRKIRESNALGETSLYGYEAGGRMSSVTQPNGNTIRYEFDALGQIVRMRDTLGTLNEKSYNASGSVLWDRSPGRGAMMYTYIAGGLVVRQVDSTGVSSKFFYDKASRVIVASDSLGNATTRGYDGLGRVVWTRNALGDTIKYQYDASGHQAALIDPDGNTTSFTYNAAGQLVATRYPDGGVDSSVYDKTGKITQKIDPKGTITTFSYDDAGRQVKKSFSDGTPADSFAYDKAGRMLKADNTDAQLTWTYDRLGRPLTHIQKVGDSTYTLTYSYTRNLGNSQLTYPHGTVVARRLDMRGRLDSIVINGTTIAADYTYSGVNVSTKTLGNGIAANYVYDAAGRLSRLQYTGGTGLPDFEYGYDLAGNILAQKKNHSLNASEIYRYNRMYQIVKFNRGALNTNDTIPLPVYYQSWTIDSRGNWTNFNDNGNIEVRTHSTTNALLTINSSSLSYDDNGNITGNDSHNYVWNAKNLLIEVDGKRIIYDALSNKVAQLLNSGRTVHFINDSWQVIEENANNGSRKEYIYGNFYNEILLQKNSDSLLYVLQENHHSICALTDKNAKVVENYHYTPYGGISIYDSLGNSITESKFRNNNFYLGKAFDIQIPAIWMSNSELISPKLGRYITRRNRASYSSNLYSYKTWTLNHVSKFKKYGTLLLPFEEGWFTGNWYTTENTVICDGAGNLIIHEATNYKYGIQECTRKHEERHKQDWINRYGSDICKDRNQGDLPNYDPPGKESYDDFLKKSECEAWKIGRKCRKEKNANCSALGKEKCKECVDYIDPKIEQAEDKVTEYCN